MVQLRSQFHGDRCEVAVGDAAFRKTIGEQGRFFPDGIKGRVVLEVVQKVG
jgi:hypothetical protein